MSPSRRDLLRSLAGLGTVACVGRPRGRRIEGAIVGGAHQRGHRLREGFRPTPTKREDVAVAILGGGIAGLSAAWALERAGLRDFVVLELEDAPGGTARSGTGPVTPYPWGAHYVPVPPPSNRSLVSLLDEIGAIERRDPNGDPVYAEQMLCRDPQERLFYRGQWYEGLYPRAAATRDDTAQLEAFEKDMRAWAGWRDGAGRRGFSVPRAGGSDAAEVCALDAFTMADYLDRKGWTSPRLRWFVEYGCRDDFGTTLAQTSAYAGVHYFAARVDAHGEPAEFLTWPEGNGRIVNHLASLTGKRLRTGALVTEVTPRNDGVEIVYHEEASGQTVGLRAGHAIFALPRFLAGLLITPWRSEPPAHLRETVYGSWMVANLTLRDRPAGRGFPLAWDNVLYDSPSLGYVVATHQSGPDLGATVLTYYLPLLDDDVRRARTRLLEASWGEWVGQILADLGRAHPGLADLVERVDIYLWGHAMVKPRPGFVWSDALAASARSLGRLHFAHTDLSGFALFEEAHYWGVRAARAVIGRDGATAEG